MNHGASVIHGAGGARIDALVQAALDTLGPATRLAEIGYDRGAILLRVLTRRSDVTAIGVEIQAAARDMPVPPQLAPRLALRTGDGLTPLAPGEVDVVVIAGMGGRTIAELLSRDPALTRSLGAFILCPSHLEADVRPALGDLGLDIADEGLTTERGRFYEIIVARPADPLTPIAHDADPIAAAWGPRLFARRDPLLGPFLEDARRRFHAAFAEGLRSYQSGPKAALGRKLALLDAALERASST